MARRCLPAFCFVFIVAGLAAADGLPAGFRRQPVVTGLSYPVAMAISPDGRIFVGERVGNLVVASGGQIRGVTTIPNVDYSVGESGLLGLACDPKFAENQLLYAFYSTARDGRGYNRVSRFTVVGDQLDVSTETVIWEIPVEQVVAHFSGGLVFGTDGYLYISSGDKWDAQRAQDLSNQDGKILRIGGDGSIPPDNPFVGVPGAAPQIWAYGFRNPFRFSIDRETGHVYVGDVGLNTAEEVDRVSAGDNGGWPNMEGPICYVDNCSGYLHPIWWYFHGQPQYGQSVTMGPMYRGKAFPAAFRNCLYVGDFTGGKIRRLEMNKAGEVVEQTLFDEACPYPVDIQLGADGALYYVSLLSDEEQGTGGVYRIEFVSSDNAAPTVAASADPRRGLPPLIVQFSSAGTLDPDNGPKPLVYSWDFGDGQASSEPNPTHTYAAPGVYRAVLVVSDGAIDTVSPTINIRVGTPPEVTLASPADGHHFRAGETLMLRGDAVDAEDGVLPDSAFTWNIFIERPDNAVNLLLGPVSGAREVTFQVPSEGRPLDESWYRVELTVRDSHGLTTVVRRDIFPAESDLEIRSEPAGIPVFLDGLPIATPGLFRAIADSRFTLTAQPTFEIGDAVYEFVGWHDGSTGPLVVIAPEGSLEIVARYRFIENSPDLGSLPESPRQQRSSDVPCVAALFPLFGALLFAGARRRQRPRAG